MNHFFLISFVVLPLNFLNAQSLFTRFAALSPPEKCWTLTHPFVAKKAFHATTRSRVVTDSIKKSGNIGVDNSGGRMDAFKHAYWIASVSVAIGYRKALKLGKAHERGNKWQFKKHQLEDQELPDSVSSFMDLHNNKQGATVVKKNKNITLLELQKKILELLEQGMLVCIKKDPQGNFLTCEGELIDLNQWRGKWNIPKCSIASNNEKK